jgi:hypothetical protein
MITPSEGIFGGRLARPVGRMRQRVAGRVRREER